MAGKSKKTRVVTFRMEHEVYSKAKRLHPKLSKWLRDKVKEDVSRKQTRKGDA